MKIFFGTGNTMIFTQVFLIGEKYPQKKEISINNIAAKLLLLFFT